MKEFRIVSIAEPDYFVLQNSREMAVNEVVRRNAMRGKFRLAQAPFTVEARPYLGGRRIGKKSR